MNSIYWFRKPKPPTPLQVAAAEFVATEHALLAAQAEHERAVANVSLFQARKDRLRSVMRELAGEHLEEIKQ